MGTRNGQLAVLPKVLDLTDSLTFSTTGFVFNSTYFQTISGMKLLMSGKGKEGNSAAREKTIKTRSTEADVIQFSGCKDSQTSADAHIGGEATGAMSYALITSLEKNKNQNYTHLLKDSECHELLLLNFPLCNPTHLYNSFLIFLSAADT